MSLKKYVNRRKAARGLPKYRRMLDPYDTAPSMFLDQEFLTDLEAAYYQALQKVREDGQIRRRP